LLSCELVANEEWNSGAEPSLPLLWASGDPASSVCTTSAMLLSGSLLLPENQDLSRKRNQRGQGRAWWWHHHPAHTQRHLQSRCTGKVGIAVDREEEGFTWLSHPFWQICKMVRKTTASHLKPYLQTLPGLEHTPPPLLWVPLDSMAPGTLEPLPPGANLEFFPSSIFMLQS
jgi:hypothetical protein